jgi:hypothetical protein
MDWQSIFAQSLPYTDLLDRYAAPEKRQRWDTMCARVRLTDDQLRLLSTFTRKMPAVCLAGAWCGDCVNQCPILEHFARATPMFELRFLDRDAREDVKSSITINGGVRVPHLVVLSEDFQEVIRYGERTLSRYRQMAAEQLGPACPTGLVPPSEDMLSAVTSEWLAEIERAQLILRLSPRLRQKHGD